MKLVYKNLLIVLVITFLFACNPPAEQASTAVQVSLSQAFEGDESDPCFQVQMQVWMEKFNHLQQDGFDMFEADIKAREAAVAAFRSCQSRSDALANDAARRD